MDCPVCHSPLEQGKKFCGKCGANVGATTAPHQPTKGPSAPGPTVANPSANQKTDDIEIFQKVFLCGAFVYAAWWVSLVFFHVHGFGLIVVPAVGALAASVVMERRSNPQPPHEIDDEMLVGMVGIVAITWGVGLAFHAGHDIHFAVFAAVVLAWVGWSNRSTKVN